MTQNRYCWLDLAKIANSDVKSQYISSLYWSFVTMTTVGYGDIHPVTNTEKVFTMGAQLVACAVFAYVIGSIEGIVSRGSKIEQDFKERILHIN
jgi:potassium channel